MGKVKQLIDDDIEQGEQDDALESAAIDQTETREALSDRATYIGSSDAHDILRTNWLQVWRRKVKLVTEDDLSDNFKVQLGLHTEPFHIDWTLRRFIEGRAEVGEHWYEMPACRQQAVQDRDQSYIGCHLDAALAYEHGAQTFVYPVEVKHSSGGRTLDELVDWYMPQLQHQMMVTGRDRLLFSAIMGNAEPERVWIGRSDDYIAKLRELYARFWKLVETREAPLASGPIEDEIITPKIKDAIPINGMKKRDGSASNEFMAQAHALRDTKAAHTAHEDAKKALKGLIADDEAEVYSPVVTLRRNAKGSVLVKIHEEDAK